ncbi:MAG: hypothetical protein ABI885_26595 [Gammaproteobacteria bacterium]
MPHTLAILRNEHVVTEDGRKFDAAQIFIQSRVRGARDYPADSISQ